MNNYLIKLIIRQGKLYRIMKLILLLIIIGTFNVTASVYSQKKTFNLNVSNATLSELFNKIESESEFKFFYNNNDIDVSKKVNIRVRNKNVETLLDEVLENTSYEYKVLENNLILLQRNQQQVEKKITGTVTDKDGNTLPGVSVMVKGSTNGVTTDANGKYVITLSDNVKTLLFSFIGMKDKEVEVSSKSVINVILQDGFSKLDEVVVIGYGTKKRATLTGSIDVVDAKTLESKPLNNVISGLQGAVPGMTITRGSGQPGNQDFKIFIRGYSTTDKNTKPLVIIDGVEGELSSLNPRDIKDFAVLKDASAAIYGARAAAGVILVETKSGKPGKLKIQYSANYAMKELSTLPEKLTVKQYFDVSNERLINGGKPIYYTQDYYDKLGTDEVVTMHGTDPKNRSTYLKDTDWTEQMFETAIQQTHNFSISGGNDHANYYLSAGMMDEDGIVSVGKDDYKRYNVRMKYNHKFNKRLSLKSNIAYVRNETNAPRDMGWAMRYVMRAHPWAPIRNPQGKYYAFRNHENPIQQVAEGGNSKNIRETWNNNFKLDFKALPGLTLSGQAAIKYDYTHIFSVTNSVVKWGWNDEKLGYHYQTSPNKRERKERKSVYKLLQAQANYTKKIGEHRFDLMAAASHEENDYEFLEGTRKKFTVEEVDALNTGDPDEQYNKGGGTHWAIRSYLGRFSYNYKDKYLFDTNIRYDGSSRFHPDKRWGLFKGFLAAYRLSEEDFIKDLNIFDNLKLRFSWGESGNQSVAGLYDYVAKLKTGTTIMGNDVLTQTAYVNGMVSSQREWEIVQNTNYAVDFSVLDSRLDVTFEYFFKKNKNMIIPIAYPQTMGDTPPKTNNGELHTWGWDLAVTWKDKIGDVSYYLRGSLSDDQNELVDYGGKDDFGVGVKDFREGYALYTIYGYKFDGYIKDEADLDAYKQIEGVNPKLSVGDTKLKDLDGNGKINTYPDEGKEHGDVVEIGNNLPRYRYSLEAGIEWKGFDFSAMVQGIGKRDTYIRYTPFKDSWYGEYGYYYGETWTPERPNAKYPKITSDKSVTKWNYKLTDKMIVDASYLKLKNVTLGYTLPDNLVKKAKLNKVRVYVSGQDLWEHHNMDGGFDPEKNGEINYYPFYRTYSFGLDITF